MWLSLQLAFATTVVVSLPLLLSRKKLFLNPAFFVATIVAWSLCLKNLYILLLHPEPASADHDPVYVGASSPDFLVAGAFLAFVGICAYVAAYLLVGQRTFHLNFSNIARRPINPNYTRRAVFALASLCVVAFIFYLLTSGAEFFELPFSAKRFRPKKIGVSNRFQYFPYYLFKIAMTSGSLTCAVALLWTQSERRSKKRIYWSALIALYSFSLMLAHFASLRLFILIVLVQASLLVYYFWARRRMLTVTILAVLTVCSFVLITFFHRIPPPVMDEPAATTSSGTAERRDPGHPVQGSGLSPASNGPSASLDSNETDDRGPSDPEWMTPSSRTSILNMLQGVASASFAGRYFMDIAKLGHIAQHFPEQRSYLGGKSLVGPIPPSETPAGASKESRTIGINSYLANAVFEEPNNNIPPGYTGELYINFGYLGLALGFLILGAFHRTLFNHLLQPGLPPLLTGCLILLIPNTTLVLLNSGLVSSVSRSVIDIGIVLVVWIPLRYMPLFRSFTRFLR